MLFASSQYSPWTFISNFFTMLCVLEVLAAFPPCLNGLHRTWHRLLHLQILEETLLDRLRFLLLLEGCAASFWNKRLFAHATR
jgi:hypothetical protein